MESRKEFEKRMTEKYPLLYEDMYGDPRETIMSFGFDIGPGWYDIIEELSEGLEKLIKPIRDKAMADPKAKCARCCRGKKWHWFFYFIMSVKYFFTNKLRAIKLLPAEIKRAKFFKYSVWNRMKFSFLLLKWYRPCRRFVLSHPRALQVKEKFGCYDKKTEILTSNGWKHFYDLTPEDEIATLENGQFIKYYRPLDIISYHYNGLMYKLVTRGVDLLVTPNHNLYVAKGTYYNGRYKPPKKIEHPMEFATASKYFGKNKRFLKGAKWFGEEPETFILPEYKNEWDRGYYGKTRKICPTREINIVDWLQFLGWYIAEGCCNLNRGEISIACNNIDNGTEELIIRNVISNCGFKVKKSMEERSALVFKIYSKQLTTWLAENCGCIALDKKVPEFVKNLSPSLIETFLASLFAGDGCLQETSYIYTSISKVLVDNIQELILKAGYTSSIYIPRLIKEPRFIKSRPISSENVRYEVNWMFYSNDHNTSNKGLAESSREEWIEYDDKVYCVSVPNNIIHIRRNGKHVWCGNSLRFYMTSNTDEIDDLIDKAEEKSYKTCEECGCPGKLRNGGWMTTLCDSCAKKKGYDLE
jgi:hypothetical protein